MLAMLIAAVGFSGSLHDWQVHCYDRRETAECKPISLPYWVCSGPKFDASCRPGILIGCSGEEDFPASITENGNIAYCDWAAHAGVGKPSYSTLRRDSDTRPKDGDAKQGSTRE